MKLMFAIPLNFHIPDFAANVARSLCARASTTSSVAAMYVYRVMVDSNCFTSFNSIACITALRARSRCWPVRECV